MRLFTVRTLAYLATVMLPLLVKAVPPGFVDEGAGRVFDITAFNFAPNPFGDGSILMATAKAGRLFAFLDLDNDPSNRLLMLDIEEKVCTEGERGLNTVLPHPDFATNRWVYLYYTTLDKNGGCGESMEDGAVNRLSRFTMLDNFELDPASEMPLLETSPLKDRIHNGGDMAFGNDGFLYVTIGE
jgi:glucose/arabinose dehydrogenase